MITPEAFARMETMIKRLRDMLAQAHWGHRSWCNASVDCPDCALLRAADALLAKVKA